jgi:surface carbohydrate biosynthesis protein
MKLIHYLKLLFKKKTKIKFKAPKKTDLVIFDHGDDQLSFLKFDKNSIYFNRGEELNLFILFKTFALRGFSNIFENYRITYLKYLKPKFIITYRCDNKAFYQLKSNIENVKTILIQWGKTMQSYFKNFKDEEKENNFHVDEMYLFGEETAKIFSKYIKGKCYSLGSLPNNRINLRNLEIDKNSLIFISQAKSKRIFPEIEKKLIRNLKNYCIKKRLSFSISTRVHPNDLNGKKNYDEILGDFKWNYYPRIKSDATGDYDHYMKVLLSEYVVTIDSTLGYEALSRNKKVAFFPLGSYSPEWCKENYITNNKTKDFYIPSKFGYPVDYNREGEFWLSDFDEHKLEKKLDFLTSTSNEEWIKLLNRLELNRVIKFDQNNKTLINNLIKIGVPIQKDNLTR